MGAPDSQRLADLIAATPRRKLRRLYRYVEQGHMGEGPAVADLRREIVRALNGPRRQHARRLFQRSFQAFVPESPALLEARRRPPWLIHRRETDGLWAAVAALCLPKLADHANREIAAAAAEQPVDEVIEGQFARGLEEQIRTAAVAQLRGLKKRQRERFGAFFGAGSEPGGGRAATVPARLRLGGQHIEMIAALIEAGPVFTPMAQRVEAACHAGEAVELAETVASETQAAAETAATLGWPAARSALVAIVAVYRGHSPLAAATATGRLPEAARPAVYEAVCLYFQGMAGQFNTDLLALLTGEGETAAAAETLWQIEADQGRFADAAAALDALPAPWRAFGLTRSLVQAAASAFRFLQPILPAPLKDETEAAVAAEVQRYTETVLPRVADRVNTVVTQADGDSDVARQLPALHWLLRLTMTLGDLPNLPAGARRPLVRWQRNLAGTLEQAWRQVLESASLDAGQRVERLGQLLSLAATVRSDLGQRIQVTDAYLVSAVTRVLLLGAPVGPAGEAVIATLLEAAEAELARNPSYQDPALTELMGAAVAAGRRDGDDA